jgi:GT2 family glycosyltransferase
VLASIAAQRGHEARIEVIVADDGSTDDTPGVVRAFSVLAPFPVRFTTAPHDGFRAAANRNRGARASRAPYLLFLDGDCLIPPDHVAQHLAHRRPRTAWTGYCAHLDEAASERIGVTEVEAGWFVERASWGERFKLWQMAWAATWYSWIGHATKPKLTSGNFGVWREDFERINGFDEAFVGWGCEDDDLGLRLRAAGVRVESILHATCTYHLWHPKSPSAPAAWREGANVEYLHRRGRLVRCAQGLVRRTRDDLRVHVCSEPGDAAAADVEIASAGGAGFSGGPAVKVLVVHEATPEAIDACRGADIVLCDRPLPQDLGPRVYPLCGLDDALDSLLVRQDGDAAPARALEAAIPEPRRAIAA